jgi:hypothetical protein
MRIYIFRNLYKSQLSPLPTGKILTHTNLPEERRNQNEKTVHPHIPSSTPHVKTEMLGFIGVNDIDELYSDIPESLRFRGQMYLPKPSSTLGGDSTR